MKKLEDGDCWYSHKNDNNEALSLLYSRYVHELFSYGMKIFGDDQLVKDCIQEVFIHLIDKKRKLILTEISSAYLFKSLRNKLFEEYRTKSHRSNNIKHVTSDEIMFDESMEQITIKSEEELSRRRILEAALGSLSNYQREAIFLKYSQGFSYEKIAEILDIDVASARTLIYRSLKKVKDTVLPNTSSKTLTTRSLILFLLR
jgi:RNA polymerase sigma factor (sigma-70 family)